MHAVNVSLHFAILCTMQQGILSLHYRPLWGNVAELNLTFPPPNMHLVHNHNHNPEPDPKLS